jgi:hypothetical protein
VATDESVGDEMAGLTAAVGEATKGLTDLHKRLVKLGRNRQAAEVRAMYRRLIEIHDGPWPIRDGELIRGEVSRPGQLTPD